MDEDTERSWASFERRRFLALTAAAAMFGLGGCAGKEKKKPTSPGASMVTGANKVEKRIKKHVDDKRRRDAALKLLDKAEDQIKLFGSLVDESRDARGRLPPERQTREELTAIIVEYDEKIRQNLVDAVDLCVELRTVITASEWNLVFTDPKASSKKHKKEAA
jgi:hypothetical protein